MRIERAIDKYLQQMQVERDWTPRSIDSIYRCLILLADDFPDSRISDYDGRSGLDMVRDHVARRYGHLSTATRATRISYLHTFFAWAEAEGFIDDDQVRKIRRPPKRRADIYRPTASELLLGERACTTRELAAWALMSRRGFRASTVCALRWGDIDLARGRARIEVKGGHRDSVPLGPELTGILQNVYRDLAPEQNEHLFTVERELWDGADHRVRVVRDPRQPATQKDLWRMVQRVCQRAGIRPLGPHALRHAFATGFLRDSGRDIVSLQRLLGHARIETTKGYVNELELEELEVALERASDARTSVAQEGDGPTLDEGLSRKPADGGGGNRTRVTTPSPTAGEDDRTPETADPRQPGLNPCHKLAGDAGDTPTQTGGGATPRVPGQEA